MFSSLISSLICWIQLCKLGASDGPTAISGLIVWGVALIRLRFMGPGSLYFPIFGHIHNIELSRKIWEGDWNFIVWNIQFMSPYVMYVVQPSAPLQRPRNSSHQVRKVRCQVCAVNDVHGKARKPEELGPWWPCLRQDDNGGITVVEREQFVYNIFFWVVVIK